MPIVLPSEAEQHIRETDRLFYVSKTINHRMDVAEVADEFLRAYAILVRQAKLLRAAGTAGVEKAAALDVVIQKVAAFSRPPIIDAFVTEFNSTLSA